MGKRMKGRREQACDSRSYVRPQIVFLFVSDGRNDSWIHTSSSHLLSPGLNHRLCQGIFFVSRRRFQTMESSGLESIRELG
jgi:hypothetical protein